MILKLKLFAGEMKRIFRNFSRRIQKNPNNEFQHYLSNLAKLDHELNFEHSN